MHLHEHDLSTSFEAELSLYDESVEKLRGPGFTNALALVVFAWRIERLVRVCLAREPLQPRVVCGVYLNASRVAGTHISADRGIGNCHPQLGRFNPIVVLHRTLQLGESLDHPVIETSKSHGVQHIHKFCSQPFQLLRNESRRAGTLIALPEDLLKKDRVPDAPRP
jgi:hypothetical protein